MQTNHTTEEDLERFDDERQQEQEEMRAEAIETMDEAIKKYPSMIV